MKRTVPFELLGLLLLLIFLVIASPGKDEEEASVTEDGTVATSRVAEKTLSEDFKAYWYTGKAEITSYRLQQVRYGEIREGQAVLIYVTEPFLPKQQVKANRDGVDRIPVLKLNATKNFVTGIYPYSIMNSTFYPVYDNQHALKTGVSIQEWCGHVYAQINNRKRFDFTTHSYFESEADQKLTLEKNILENEIWTKIRVNPEELPIGDLKIIPSLEYICLEHKTPRAYKAKATLSTQDNMSTYTLTYPVLDRELTIRFAATFPYAIESWTEVFKSGLASDDKTLKTEATKIKSLNTAYWQQNKNADVRLRDSLGLK